MIGGYIIQITPMQAGISQIWCQGTGCEQHDECAVDVRDAKIMPEPGDSCWWQSGKVYCSQDTIVLEKVGYSYDPRDTEGA
jgi:hypothetical protein